VPVLVFLGISVFELHQMYATDVRCRQTSDAHHRNASYRGGGVIKADIPGMTTFLSISNKNLLIWYFRNFINNDVTVIPQTVTCVKHNYFCKNGDYCLENFTNDLIKMFVCKFLKSHENKQQITLYTRQKPCNNNVMTFNGILNTVVLNLCLFWIHS